MVDALLQFPPLLSLHFLVLLILALFGLHRLHLLSVFARWRKDAPLCPCGPEEWPFVTVQLPVFNERFVVERLIEAASEMDYPLSRLQIQVLDDSTDETIEISERCAARLRARGVNIEVLHRHDRRGFKAGALQAGLDSAEGDFVAVFDADFVPPRAFLKETIPHFEDDAVGMVQARWGHLNEGFSVLNRCQALLLDGHFVIEHAARNWSGRFFNFNGTAGIWRKTAIVTSGGWQADTLTEDLDLSYRAQLQGWRFVYRADLVVPGELPDSMAALKSQQYRWAKGSIETARKLVPRIVGAREYPWWVRLEACCHLLANVAFPFVLALTVLLPANVILTGTNGGIGSTALDLSLFGFTTLPFLFFYFRAGRERGVNAKTLVPRVLAALALGIGLAVNQTRAVISASLGRRSPFVRTPKRGSEDGRQFWRAYAMPVHWTTWLEFGLGLLQLAAGWIALIDGRWPVVPFLLLFAAGFLGVSSRTAIDAFPARGYRSTAA